MFSLQSIAAEEPRIFLMTHPDEVPQRVPTQGFDELCQFSSIPTIDYDPFESWKYKPELCYWIHSPHAVMNICGMYFDRHRQSKCVHNNILLPAFDSFTPVNAIFTAVYIMGSPYTSRIYQADTWVGLLAKGLAYRVPKMVRHRLKYPFQLPFAEIEYALCQGSNSLGSIRHGQPVLVMYSIAFIIFRNECFRFLSLVSTIFFITCHCLSVRLVG